MSQNDFTLANQSFPAFRADLNSALQALASNNSGGSAPSTTFANMWWYDSANNIMYIRNEDNDAWIKFAELDQANDKFVLSGTLQLDDGTVSAPALTFNSDTNMGIYRGGTDILKFVTAGTDAITIDASQNVGIGTSSGTGRLSLDGTGTGATTVLKVNNTDSASFVHAQQNIAPNLASTNTVVNFVGKELSAKNSGYIGYTWVGAGSNSNRLTFGHYGSDYLMNLTADGNLLVGTTNANPAESNVVGIGLLAGNSISVTDDGAAPIQLNRKTSNGSIAIFRKDGSTIGSIGTPGNGDMYLSSGNIGLLISGSGTVDVYPCDNNGAARDNVADFGQVGARWDDIYATNGTIQTSDQNEKNTITDSDLGIDFIKRLSPKSYIFNGKTRTHYGLIAQDVETVLTDIGKTGTDFAGFIKSDISEEEDGSEYRYGLRYTEFVAPLIKAVKDQQAIIEDLQARIVALETA